jgi:hypothetical protein
MRPRSIALLVLLALALRLGTGPHPCHAMAAMAATAASGAHAACHQQSHPKAPAPGDEDCCKNGDPLCASSCQTAAVLQVALPAPVPLAFQEQIFASEHGAALPVVFPIDHVPLA